MKNKQEIYIFPTFKKCGEVGISEGGMTLRDYFAAHCDVSAYNPHESMVAEMGKDPTVEELAEFITCIRMAEADAMIKARISALESAIAPVVVPVTYSVVDDVPEPEWMTHEDIQLPADGWLQHNGSECPIPDAKHGEYEIRYRDGMVSVSANNYPASSFYWKHHDVKKDIVAYRMIDNQDNNYSPDFGKAGDEYNYWACDKSGRAAFFMNEPYILSTANAWFKNREHIGEPFKWDEDFDHEKYPRTVDGWRTSLRHRKQTGTENEGSDQD